MHKGQADVLIFYTVDDAYIPFLAVSLRSLIDNTSRFNNYSIKILYTDITQENMKKIKAYEKKNISIEFVNLSEQLKEIESKLYTRNYYSNTTYYRLFIPKLYSEYNKAVYIDSDTIILDDIAKLYHKKLDDNLLQAVPDGAVQVVKVFQEYVEKVIGLIDYNYYFNAGVLLLNLEELRNYKFEEKFIYLLNRMKFEVAQDQDYLNRLCKGRVKILDDSWNKMPITVGKNENKKPKILHFNLGFKPWHFDDVPYKEFFWKYAKKTEFYNDIKQIKENYSEEAKINDDVKSTKLVELAKKEADCVGDDRIPKNFIKRGIRVNKRAKKSKVNERRKEREKILSKIAELEKEGKFDIDVEEDPPTIVLTPENIDYLRKKLTSKIKRIFANEVGERFLDNLLKNNKLIIKEVKGIENLQNVTTGAMITCNHFNPFDCFAIEKVFEMSGKSTEKRLYKIIREGNYTNFPGLYGFFLRNCDTLPLSSNKRTMVEFMKSVDSLLQKGEFILIYPEQSMWWNYRKPKPLKHGAYKLATRSNVPVIPIFITMQDSNIIGDDGFPIQEYTVNIAKPIYPDETKTARENMEYMLEQNAKVWKEIYEDFYGIPLEYTTKTDNLNV